MRISADKRDPGYPWDDPDLLFHVRVFLDGEEAPATKHVITADTEKGWILFFLVDADGKPISRGGNWQLVELFGDVQIQLLPPYASID